MEVIQCKEYFLDCVNYHSWILRNFCNITATFTMIMTIPKSVMNNVKCPLKVSYFIIFKKNAYKTKYLIKFL